MGKFNKSSVILMHEMIKKFKNKIYIAECVQAV